MDDKERIPQEIFDAAGIELDERLLNFFVASGTGITREHLSWAIAVSAGYSSTLLERGLKDHARALEKAARASEKYARSLATATWLLVGVTAILAIATLALVLVTARLEV